MLVVAEVSSDDEGDNKLVMLVRKRAVIEMIVAHARFMHVDVDVMLLVVR